jgi:A/G-specific adenine glycosylase
MAKTRPGPRQKNRDVRTRDRGFAAQLIAWYRAHHRRLPWRESTDPYKIWISEVMLQQTTVGAVLPYFERWMRLFPDLPSLARAPLQKILRAWQGLGYYQRARNLHRAARILVRRHGGRIPNDEQTLGGLPGFGPYTTAAVLSLAFGQPLPVIEANARRVLMRVVGLTGEASARHDRALREYLQGVFPDKTPGLFNQAIMELGALVCRSRSPQCLLCPVPAYCRAAREGNQEATPRPRKRTTQRIEAVVAVIEHEGRFLIQKRPAPGLFAGLWEFPGGKIQQGESLEEALHREVREEVGAHVRNIRFLTTVNHAYTKFRVTLHVFLAELKKALPRSGPDRRWVTLSNIRRYPMPSGSVQIVNVLTRTRGAGRQD